MSELICTKHLHCSFCQKHKLGNDAACQNCWGWIPKSAEHIEELWRDNYYPHCWLAPYFTLEEAMSSEDDVVQRELDRQRERFLNSWLCHDAVARLS